MESRAIKINMFNGNVACHCRGLADNTLNATHRPQDKDSYSEIMAKTSTRRHIFQVLSEGPEWASLSLISFLSIFTFSSFLELCSSQPASQPRNQGWHSVSVWLGWYFYGQRLHRLVGAHISQAYIERYSYIHHSSVHLCILPPNHPSTATQSFSKTLSCSRNRSRH